MIERSNEIGSRVDKRPVKVKYYCINFRAPHCHADARPQIAIQGPIMRPAFHSGHSGASNLSRGATIADRPMSPLFPRLAPLPNLMTKWYYMHVLHAQTRWNGENEPGN